MDLQLAGKVAVVTGASKGIGLAIVKTLAAEGMHVVAGARTVDALADLKGVTPMAVDLMAPDGPGRLVQKAIDQHGKVDVLVNNVGAVRLRLEGFLAINDDEFAWSMQMNFFTNVRATRAALPSMLKTGKGSIVHVCSVNATFEPDGGTIDYGAAKAAVLNFSKSIAQELGKKGIRSNCVSPGPVTTDLWLGKGGVADIAAKAMGVDADTARQKVIESIGGFATGRFTSPDEVANLVAFLASERTANVTGSNYIVDGGLLKTT